MKEVVKEKKYKIPLFYPYVSEEAIEAATKTLRTKFIGQGPKIQKFENAFGEKFGVENTVATNSCTAALHMAYILAGVEEGDEVICPLFTCSATIHPILWQGAKPVFCDIKDDFTIDPDHIEKSITDKTKAIVVMHYGGCMCEMDRIMEIAEEYDLPVIEDTAQAVGAKYKGQYAGTIGDFGCFSFQAIKYMTTIDGGMLVVKDKDLYEKAKRIRWFGIDRDLKIKKGWQQFKDWERRKMTYDVWEKGYKYHMNDFNAAMGLAHLKELDRILKHQDNLNELYRENLADTPVEFPPQKKGDTHWLMTVSVDRRDDFAEKLKEAGVETNCVHIRNDVYTLFKPYAKGRKFPKMDEKEMNYLVLPMHPHITEDDVEYICNMVKYGW